MVWSFWAYLGDVFPAQPAGGGDLGVDKSDRDTGSSWTILYALGLGWVAAHNADRAEHVVWTGLDLVVGETVTQGLTTCGLLTEPGQTRGLPSPD